MVAVEGKYADETAANATDLSGLIGAIERGPVPITAYCGLCCNCNRNQAFEVVAGDSYCGTSYYNLWGPSRESSYPEPGETAYAHCRRKCQEKEGCTAFEYNFKGNEGYKCFTYTDGKADQDWNNPQDENWITCLYYENGEKWHA